jgi:hypothetical protein
VLEAAIERVTRALLSAPDEVIPELVAERRAMREELEGLRRDEKRGADPTGVASDVDAKRRRRLRADAGD